MAVDTYALTTLAKANKYVLNSTGDGGTEDAYMELMINRASDIIEQYCNRKFKARLHVKERHDGEKQTIIPFNNPPVLAVNLDELAWDATNKTVTRSDGGSFYADGFSTGNTKILVQNSKYNSGLLTLTAVSTGGTTITFSDTIYSDTDDNDVIISEFRSLWIYDNEVDEGSYYVSDEYVYYPVGFDEGKKNIKLTYYGGYKTIPDDLEMACLQVVKNLYEQNENIKSESLGDHSITLLDTNSCITEATMEILDKYIRIPL